MAKKETTKENPATVASKAAAKVAADVLRQNPDINEVHVTSDGTAFYSRNNAQNHANSLPNREVFSTRRGSVAAKASPTKPKDDTPAETPAANEPEVDELTGEPVNDESNKSKE